MSADDAPASSHLGDASQPGVRRTSSRCGAVLASRIIDESLVQDSSNESLVRGARLFDAGAFFEAHEVWEERWRHEPDEIQRTYLQGLIQVAAGFHKILVMGSADSAHRLLTKGLAKLNAVSTSVAGAEIALFCTEVRACATALAAGRFDRTAIPKMRLEHSRDLRSK
jgi:predicted metal-dependent hydrolase